MSFAQDAKQLNLLWGNENIIMEVLDDEKLPNTRIFRIDKKDEEFLVRLTGNLAKDKRVVSFYLVPCPLADSKLDFLLETKVGRYPERALYKALGRL